MPITSRDMTIQALLGQSKQLQIPLYQRPYKWGKEHWSDLFIDVTANNYVTAEEAVTFSYFIGTLILINDPITHSGPEEREVVDGQQRLTTISLWLAALRHIAHSIYKRAVTVQLQLEKKQKRADKVLLRPLEKLSELKDQPEKMLAKFSERETQQKVATTIAAVLPLYKDYAKRAKTLVEHIDSLLQTGKDPSAIRLRLGKQNKDNVAYDALMKKLLVPLADEMPKPQQLKTATHNHLVFKAFLYFLREYTDEKLGVAIKAKKGEDTRADLGAGIFVAAKNDHRRLKAVIEKSEDHLGMITRLAFAIEVATDDISAYMLFEGLNYRAEPLLPIDLLKNHLLSHVDRGAPDQLNDAYDSWTSMVGLIPAQMQHNFLRHAYLAFPDIFPNYDAKISESALLRQYKLSITDATAALRMNDFLHSKAVDYQGFANATALLTTYPRLAAELDVLSSISAKPAGLLLIKLLAPEKITEPAVQDVIRDLQRFFARRHLTQSPKTQALEGIMLDLARAVDGLTVGDFRTATLLPLLRANSVDLKDAIAKACDIGERQNLARAVLAMYEYSLRTPEDRPMLCTKTGNKADFTLEHVLPQTLSPEWRTDLTKSGIAASDIDSVKDRYLQFIGNLTLTRFNTKLSNSRFVVKRDKSEDGDPIGYKNGLKINATLATWDQWTRDSVENRGKELLDGLGAVLAFDDEPRVCQNDIEAMVRNYCCETGTDEDEEEEGDPSEQEDEASADESETQADG